MPEDSNPWPIRWIVNDRWRDTGFAMLRRALKHDERDFFEKVAADHRIIGFTHFGLD